MTIWGIVTELAIQAGEGKKKVKILKAYTKFEHLFSKQASHRFLPRDHGIMQLNSNLLYYGAVHLVTATFVQPRLCFKKTLRLLSL